MNDNEVFWLAGLLEGEGSFLKPAPSEAGYPRVKISMSDYDVIQRVASLFEVNYIHTRTESRSVFWREIYDVQIKGSRAVQLMQQLCPLMGARRKEQIENAIGYQPATHATPTAENSFSWLAGILEGEGSFLKGPPSAPNRPRIQLQMSDKDVIDKASRILGVKTKGPYMPSRAKEHYKPRYVSSLRGKKAVEVMKHLHPLMGQRRQTQITEAIVSFIPNCDYGDNHPQAKLNSEQVADIKRRIRRGEGTVILAEEFGVDPGLIWQIKAGRIWQHIPWPS